MANSYVAYTRMRAPYVNPEGFRFTIYRKGVFSDLGKLLGMQDIEVGDPDFDEAFIIKGNDESKVRDLFADRPDSPDDSGSAHDPAPGEGQRRMVRSQVPRSTWMSCISRSSE